jgi:hypothetical protein
MPNSIASLTQKLNTLKQRVDHCLENCKPYKDDLEREFYAALLKAETRFAGKLSNESIAVAEAKLGCCLPAPYIELLNQIGPFTVGYHELVLLNDLQLGLTLGQLIEERIEIHSLDNFKDGHYHDFIVLAEYGYFPQEDMDYSSGLAFNRKDVEEIISYHCDDFYLGSSREERLTCAIHPFDYLENCLNSLTNRLDEPIEALNEQIEFFKQQDEE